MKTVDLSILIRLLETMADKDSWRLNDDGTFSFVNPIILSSPAMLWEISEDTLIIVRSILDNQNANVKEDDNV